MAHSPHAKGRDSTTRPAFHKSNQRTFSNITSAQKFQAIQNRIAEEALRHAPNTDIRTWLNWLGGLV